MSRFYPKSIPCVGELVMASVDLPNEHGFICSLPEYGGIEAYLPMSELSRKKSIAARTKVGQELVLQVIRVDGKYVDLSKKYVREMERTIGNEKYQKSKEVHSIFKRVAEAVGVDLDEFLARAVWPMYGEYSYTVQELVDNDSDEEVVVTSQDHPYWDLRRYILEGKEINMGGITEPEKTELKKILQHRIKVQQINCQCIVEITCYSFKGIDTIVDAGKKMKVECPNVSLRYKAAPEYLLSVIVLDKVEGEVAIKKAVNVLNEELKLEGGECVMKDKVYYFTL
jgi:translation initiation factor 2 subunit 1